MNRFGCFCLRIVLGAALACALPEPVARAQTDPVLLYLPALSTYQVQSNGQLSLAWMADSSTRLTPTPNGKLLSAIDTGGRLHMIWATLTAPRLLYHAWLSSQGWSAPAAVAESLGISETLYGPYVDSVGGLHLVWRADLGTGATPRYRLYYSRWDGSTWSPVEDVYPTANAFVQAMAHSDGAGGVAITVLDTPLFGAAKAFQITGGSGSWTTSAAIQPSYSGAGVVWPDEAGGVRFIGVVSGQPDQLRVDRWLGGAFVVQNRVSALTLGTRETQLDGLGNLLTFGVKSVPIVGGTGYAAVAQCLRDDGAVDPEVTMATYGTAYVTLVKAADRSDLVALAWKTDTSGLAVRVFAGCSSGDTFNVPPPAPPVVSLQAAAVSAAGSRLCLLWRSTYDYRDLTATCANLVR